MIIVKLSGGIGNQMFQYAAGRQLAHRNNALLKLDITHYDRLVLPDGLPYRSFDLSIFDLELHIATKKEIALFKNVPSPFYKRVLKKIKNTWIAHQEIIEPHFNFFPGLLNLKGNIYLDGYWQSEKYFKNCEGVIRKDFKIKTTLEKEGFELLEKIRNTNAVCLNVRRQEFASNRYANQFVGEEYIRNAIEQINQKVSSPHFFIFSDELSWCKQNLKLKEEHTFVEEKIYGDKFRDCLYLMTNCKHFIIPNSTFGWWGAWLGNNPDKIVIAPQKWLSDSKRNTDDVIPVSWIKL